MGRESKAIRTRVCPSCQHAMFVDAKGMKEHAEVCKRARAAGLILPGVLNPNVKVFDLSKER